MGTSGVEIKAVKVFSKDSPCSKVEIWNTFRGPAGFHPRAVVEAQGEIGVNAPKHMLKQGYLVYKDDHRVDQYVLTNEGMAWLTEGLLSYLKRHPDRQADVLFLSDLLVRTPAPKARARVVRSGGKGV